MEFKSIFRSLLGKTDRESSKNDSRDTEVHHKGSGSGSLSIDSKSNHEDNRELPEDESVDTETIKGIAEIYYEDADFDMIDFELKSLPSVLQIDQIDGYRDYLRKQSYAVTRQLSRKILENQALYVRELERVIDLQLNLSKAASVCVKGRNHLSRAKEEAAMGVLKVLSKHRRKILLMKLLKSLRFIKTLQQTDVRLKELLEESDYPTAIQLCLECQKAAETFKQYKCIRELSSDLQETLDQTEEQLDVALSRVCNDFDEKQYEKIQSAYLLLGKTQTAIDQLQMHYLNTVNNVALQVVSDYIALRNSLPSANEDFNFSSLCKNLGLECFTPCLIDLCKKFWIVMSSYKRAMGWHEKYGNCTGKESEEPKSSSAQNTNSVDEELEKSTSNSGSIEAMFDRKYVKTKLEQGLTRIWQDIQQKIKTLVLSNDLAYFKYDEFIHFLDIINRLILIGEEFCGSKSQGLQESVRTQTINYFKAYHRATLDELRMFLENEVWELCPVQTNFKIFNLQEFEFLKPSLSPKKGHNRTHSGTLKPESGFFKAYEKQSKTPFHEIEIDGISNAESKDDGSNTSKGLIEKIFNDDDDDDELDDEDDIPDELKMDYVDEKTGDDIDIRPSTSHKKEGKVSQNTPVISNTTLNVLRSFGKYMQMMSVLKPIAFDVVICMSQLFDYYLYAVHSFFASGSGDVFSDLDSNANGDLSNRMQMSLKRISNNIIRKQEVASNQNDLKVLAPNLSPMVDLTKSQELYGLSHRIVGVESLVFLAKQLKSLHSHLDSLIPVGKRAFLGQFFSQTIDVAEELRVPIYRIAADKVIAAEQTLSQMAMVKWDIKDIMSQHSSYVDLLVQELQLFSKKMSNVARNVPINEDANVVLWTHVIRICNRTFVDGFSNVKKCSNEGRALMQLDYQQFLIKLEKITSVRPITGKEFVEGFIKAFYLNEYDLEKWLREHTEYSIRHQRSLVTCGTGSHISKKTKNRLLDILDEVEKSRTR